MAYGITKCGKKWLLQTKVNGVKKYNTLMEAEANSWHYMKIEANDVEREAKAAASFEDRFEAMRVKRDCQPKTLNFGR